MALSPSDIRNVVLLGHSQSGKTSIGDALLFNAGANTRLGKVADGTSMLDFEPEELDRQRTYVASTATGKAKKKRITILDTPGDSNFQYDTRTCAMAAEGAVIAVSALDGVEVGTERGFDLAKELGLARVLFVNKLDKERADFDKVVAELRDAFGAEVAPMQIPIGKEDGFKGVVDLLTMKAYVFDGETFSAVDVPADLAGAANSARESLVEAIASADDALLEKYLDTMELSEEEIDRGLRTALTAGSLVPVLCGSAPANIGLPQLLDLIADVFPTPLDRPAAKGVVPGTEEEQERAASADEPLSGLCFKTMVDKIAGKLSLIKVLSGTLDPSAGFYNPKRRSRERIGSMVLIQGKKTEHTDEAPVGAIIAIPKLKDTQTGDTICDEKAQIQFPEPPVDPPAISFSVKPKSKGDEDKISAALTRLREEDPSLVVSRDEFQELIISGAGDAHVRIAMDRLARKFGLELELSPPRIPYRETIKGKATGVEGKHKKQSGGRGQYAVCYVDIEPVARGEGLVFENKIFGGSIPRQFIPSVEKGLKERMATGVIAGYPVVDIKVSLTDGKYHDVDSDNFSFERAGSKALRAGFEKIKGKILLEPVMNLAITVPDDAMGDVLGEINSRRGRVQGMSAKGKFQVIMAQMPMNESQDFSPRLRSITQDRGTFTIEFSHYDELPAHVAERVIANSQLQEEED